MSAAMTKRMLEEAIVRRDQELSLGRETPVVVVAANEAQARSLRRRLAAVVARLRATGPDPLSLIRELIKLEG